MKLATQLLTVVVALPAIFLSIAAADATLDDSVRHYNYGKYYRRCLGPILFCVLKPTASKDVEGRISKVHGYVFFMPRRNWRTWNCETKAFGRIAGLGDQKPHGFHIHEYGNVSDPTGKGTGGHYNPKNVTHNLPGRPGQRHAGDLGNLYPNKRGRVRVHQYIPVNTNAIKNRGLIIHAKEDDGGQPTGNAGARLAQCRLARWHRRRGAHRRQG